MSLSIVLFGAPSIAHGDDSHALGFERRGQLLAFLALKRSWVSRAEVAALLWPDQETRLAYANLRKALFRLASLPWAARVESNANALRFDVDTDVSAFEDALRERRLSDVAALYRGPLLAGFDDPANDAWTSWLGFERDRLRAAWRTAARELLAGDLEGPAAVELAARLADDDPLDEDALGTLMNWLARTGQLARARQAYRDFTKRLQQELGLAPSAELIALHDGMEAPVARMKRGPAASHDEGFVGRVVETRRAAALLAQDDCRLLTITGPGGVGKTRLARHAMDQLAAGFPDGAAYVPLDDIEAEAQVSGRLALELGVPLTGGQDPLDQVIGALRERRLLLVLDNFEQLATAARTLDRLTAACPGVKLVVTSRVRLGLAGEWLLPLEGLPCPDVEDEDHADAFDAVRLFIRTAQRVSPTLDVAAETAAIVAICRQVEGLPLALELAAAWTRVLSCREIATELSRGIELLRTSDPAHPARHASVEMVFDQSWRLLSPVEREALARLSVFHGGFSAEAARAVAAAPLPVLAALADKSLVRKEAGRLFQHPLVQQFAEARLAAGKPRDDTERSHAEYFNGLLHQIRRPVENGDRDALRQIDTEFENIRAAWRWAVEHRPEGVLARSVHALTHYSDHRSRPDEALALLREALASPGMAGDASTEALLLGKAAHLEYRLDRYAESIDTATRGLARLRPDARTDADARAQCLKVLGTCHLRLGHAEEAQGFFERTLKLAPASSDLRLRAAILSSLALLRKVLGDYEEARRLSIDAMEEQRRLGDVAGEALSLNNLAALVMEQQEFEAAAGYLRPALELCDRLGLATTRGYVLANLAGVELKLGRYEAAEAYGERALEHAAAVGNRFVVSFLRFQFVRFAIHRNDLGRARAQLRDGMELALDIHRPTLIVEGIIALCETLAAQGEPGCARAIAQFALDHPQTAAMERDELARVLRKWPAAGANPGRWPPDLTLEDLCRRIVAEAPIGYAPLVAALTASR